MSETEIIWRSPLAGAAVPGRYGNPDVPAPGIALTVITARDIVRIAPFTGKRTQANRALRKLCRLALPAVGKASAHGGFTLAWAALDAWLAMAPGTGRGDLYGRLSDTLGGSAAIVDQTHGLTAIAVSGRHVRDLLAKGTGVDLRPASFAADACAATQMEHTAVHLRCTGEDAFELLVPTSQAASFWHFLTEMALEFGFEVSHT